MDYYPRINAHGHLLPYPEQIPAFLKDNGIFWIDDEKEFMFRTNWKRPVTDPSFFLNEKIEWMAKNNIQHEVILNLTQLYGIGLEKGMARDVLRFQNDFNASIQSDHPSKFTSGFALPLIDMEMALREMERCVEFLNLKLLCLPTHFLDEQEQWVSVADERLFPLFQLADDYGLSVQIHPPDDQRIMPFNDRFWRYHLVWMCALTADTYHLFTLLGLNEKFPNIRTCFAHGNQFSQMNIGRRIQGFSGRPDLFTGAKHPQSAENAKNIFFDSLLHDVHSLALLIKRHGTSQLVVGIDDPYPLGEMETVPGCYPGKLIDDALVEGVLTHMEQKEIWFSNSLNWLGEVRKSELINILLHTDV